MNLSVIIPAYNNVDKVLRCVNTLQRFEAKKRLHNEALWYVVQDDASPAYDLRGLIPICAAFTYRNEVNLGFNGNVGEGIKKTRSDVVAIVNQDVFATDLVSQGWDKTLLAAFDDPAVGIVGPKLLFPDGSIQSAGGLFDARCTPVHRCLGYADPMYAEVNTPQEVTWVTGAFLAIRRSLWEQLGGFDPIYAPSYFEDVDLCLRAREAGYKVMYDPRVTFFHEVGSTGGSPHFMRSALAFKERWVDTGRIKPDVHYIARYLNGMEVRFW